MDHLTSGNLYVKVAETEAEIISAQELRYQVFYEEMGAVPNEEMQAQKREIDIYDPYCQHLLVVDQDSDAVVGTYRILTLEDAEQHGVPLYTEIEFDLSKLKNSGKRIMEVSRSCVAQAYRSKAAINLLWQGIADLVVANHIDYLVGVPSLHGTDMKQHLSTLAYLQAFHLADDSICPVSKDDNGVVIPELDKTTIDVKREFVKLPPLLKGYLRIGALIGQGVYVDHQFNTVDVVIVVPIQSIDARYQNHYIHKNDA